MDDLLFIFSFLISITFYCIGKFKGERIIKECFDEVIDDLQTEKEEWDTWDKNGRKVNQVPRARFGVTTAYGHPDYRFKIAQQMGEDIKKLIDNRKTSKN
jgi:hypothetical protein